MASTNVEVKKWGNSLGVIIPKDTARKLKLSEGEEVSLEIVPRRKVSGFGIAKGLSSFKREIEEREF